MAYIYRYELKNKDNRECEDLRIHTKCIDEIIKKVFMGNLKSVEVFYDYYEFRLHHSLPSKTDLQSIGKGIVNNCWILNAMKKRYERNTQLFRRKKNSYYGFLEDIEYENGIYLLNFDVVEKEDSDRIQRDIVENQLSKIAILETLDTFSVTVEVREEDPLMKKFKALIVEGIEDISNHWYLLEGEHVEDGNSFFFLDFTERQDVTTNFRLSSINSLAETQKNWLESFFSLDSISHSEETNFKNNKEDFFISIYNVGQGLCSAICNLQSQPILYFDFGGGERKNAITYPKNINFCFTQKPKIVLSHLHRDHWIGASYCKEALETEWIVPDQKKGPQVTKLLANISKKGALTVLKSGATGIKTPYGDLFLGTGKNNHFHNDGIGFLVETRSNKRYLMPGDNRYQYIPSHFLENLNGIIASHHGGEYFQNSKGKIAIPFNNLQGRIVYSYGKHTQFHPNNNSYGHPSYVHEYKRRNWIAELHTPNGHCYLERPKVHSKCTCGCTL